MRRVATKFVPELLLCEHKDLHLDIAQDMLECRKPAESKNCFTSGITKLLAKLEAVALFNTFRHCAQNKNATSTLHKHTHWLPGSD
jgi:hypothetical protein